MRRSVSTIFQAIQNVSDGREQGHGVNGVWRVYREGDLVMLEIYPASPVVVCTVAVEVEE